MCELFAVSADHSIDITDWLRTFFSHSDKHPHGYGLAVFPQHENYTAYCQLLFAEALDDYSFL